MQVRYTAGEFKSVFDTFQTDLERLFFLYRHRDRMKDYKSKYANEHRGFFNSDAHTDDLPNPGVLLNKFIDQDMKLIAAKIMRSIITSGGRLAHVLEKLGPYASQFEVDQDQFWEKGNLQADTDEIEKAIFGYCDNQNQPQGISFQKRLDDLKFDGDIPLDLICPISQCIMNDPVTVSNGITYDRSSLIKYFTSKPGELFLPCPLTQIMIPRADCHFGTNIIFKSQIDVFVSAKEKEGALKNKASPLQTNGLFPDEGQAYAVNRHQTPEQDTQYNSAAP